MANELSAGRAKTGRGASASARVWRRTLVVVLIACLFQSVILVLGSSADLQAQSASENAGAVSSVRIAARKLANGNLEFGLQLVGGNEWLPRARFFPYTTVEVGRWLRASPYGMSDGEDVRIRARKLANGKVEFGLQVGADRQWLPSQRNFPYHTAAVNRWLYASWYTVGEATSPLDENSPSASAPPPVDRSSCTFESAMSQVLPSVFQVVADMGTHWSLGTGFYIGNDQFVTAAHVVLGARSIRLQNHVGILRQVHIVGADAPSDVAVLRADGSSVLAMRFGDESSLGIGARIAAVGYPANVYSDPSVTAAASIVSGLLSSKWYDIDHDYVYYVQTDAAANRGNSGGPVIDECGQVIGLVNSKIIEEGVEGLIYAVTENTVQEAMRRVGQGAEPSRSTSVDLYLIQKVLGDSVGGTATYALSTSCGVAIGADYEVDLREGRFDVTMALGVDAEEGLRVAARTVRGEACIATATVTDLPPYCTATENPVTANLSGANERVLLEFVVLCLDHTPDPAAESRWEYYSQAESRDGSIVHLAYATSYNHDYSYPWDDDPAQVGVECWTDSEGNPERLDVYVWFGGQFVAGGSGRNGTIYVNYRFGSGGVVEGYWWESVDDVAAYVPEEDVDSFLRLLRDVNQYFVIRAWNHDDSIIGTTGVALAGADAAIARVVRVCSA